MIPVQTRMGVFGSFLLLLCGAVSAQTTPNAGVGAAPTLQVRPRADLMVTIDAVASQAADHIAAGDLRVEDNGQRVAPENLQVLDDGRPETKAQLILVLDLINSSQQEFVRSTAAAAAFLRERKGVLSQPTSVLFVSTAAASDRERSAAPSQSHAVLSGRRVAVHRLATTADGDTLAADLETYAKAITGTPGEGSGLDVSERVRLSLEALSFMSRAEAGVAGAKLTVWLSRGWPYLARSDAKSSAQLFDSVIYFSDALRAARMVLYMVDPSGITQQPAAETNAFQPANSATLRVPVINTAIGTDFYQNYLKGVRKPQDANPNDLTLQVLSVQSGGLVLQNNNDVKAMIERCAADVARVVTVRYLPPQAPGVVAYHEIRIRSTHPAQTWRARTGFYTR